MNIIVESPKKFKPQCKGTLELLPEKDIIIGIMGTSGHLG